MNKELSGLLHELNAIVVDLEQWSVDHNDKYLLEIGGFRGFLKLILNQEKAKLCVNCSQVEVIAGTDLCTFCTPL